MAAPAVPTRKRTTGRFTPAIPRSVTVSGHRPLPVALAIGLMLAGPAGAFTLGEMDVQSALGEPLRMVIPVDLHEAAADRECIRVLPVDDAAMREASLARVGLIETPRGTALLVTTARPVHEPALTLGIEVSCSGRHRRDYAILLDPPLVDPVAVAERPRPPGPEPSASAVAPSGGDSQAVSASNGGVATGRIAANRNPEQVRPSRPASATRSSAPPVSRRAVAKPRLTVSRSVPGTPGPGPTLEELQVEIVVLEKRLLELRTHIRESGIVDLPPAIDSASAATTKPGGEATTAVAQASAPILVAAASPDPALIKQVIETQDREKIGGVNVSTANATLTGASSPPWWLLFLGGLLSFAFGAGAVTAWTRWRQRSKYPPLPGFARAADDEIA